MHQNKIPSPRQLQLLSLVVRPKVGRDVAKLYEQEAGKAIPYGTLYTLLDEMEEAGWVGSRGDERGGRRVRIYKIKAAGVRALNRGREHHQRLADFGKDLAQEGA